MTCHKYWFEFHQDLPIKRIQELIADSRLAVQMGLDEGICPDRAIDLADRHRRVTLDVLPFGMLDFLTYFQWAIATQLGPSVCKVRRSTCTDPALQMTWGHALVQAELSPPPPIAPVGAAPAE